MNLMLRLGLPLERWLNGILLLLQKEIGNIDIDKLRFIILFEADFNFLLKKIFAQRLTAHAIENDTLPIEFYSMKGKSAKEAIITRTLWCDINRLKHRSFAVVSADLSQCFDMIGHSQCSLAMQAQGCPIKPISIMLFTLQNMNYWIRSAYGDAKTLFCAASDDPYMGMGQGSGGSNPGCAFTFTPVVNAYKRKGYHPTMISAWSRRTMLLAALMWVDDTDLLLKALDCQTTEEFMSHIQ